MKEAVAFKKRFDPVLRRVLDAKVREVRLTTSDPFVLGVVKHARRLVLAGGKRVRPFLAFLAYKYANRKTQTAKSGNELLETLVGLELFHAFALIHDDIMDKGKTRHGVKTANVVFGDAQAILLGDLLFEWASEIIAPTKGQTVFSTMAQEVILGQMLDVDAIRRSSVSDRFIQDKMRLKTAMYTFVRPMQFGVMMASVGGRVGATRASPLHDFCERFGLPLGLAFQIQDDLLDLTASSAKLGKSSMNDVREGQKTVFSQIVSRKTQNRRMLEKMKGKKLTASDRKRLKKLFEESGAIEYGTSQMRKYFAEAEKAAEGKKEFLEIVEYIRSRTH